MHSPFEHLPAQISAACVTFAPALLALGATAAVSQVSPLEFAGSDPLVRMWGYPATTVVTVFAGLLASAYWIHNHAPSRRHIRNAVLWACAGASVACGLLLLSYTILGPVIPAFIPPEESAQAGMVLGLTAGMLEEVVFRIIGLPALLALLARRLSATPATLFASLIVGLLFALSHEMAGDPFQLQYFITRTLFPGAVMSIVYVKIHPAAVLYGHTVAHIVIPLLFTSHL